MTWLNRNNSAKWLEFAEHLPCALVSFNLDGSPQFLHAKTAVDGCKGKIWTQICLYFPLYLQISNHCPNSMYSCPFLLGRLRFSKGLTRVIPPTPRTYLYLWERKQEEIRERRVKEKLIRERNRIIRIPISKWMNHLDWKPSWFKPTDHSACHVIFLSDPNERFVKELSALSHDPKLKDWGNASE